MLQVVLFIAAIALHLFIKDTVYLNYVILAFSSLWCVHSCVKPIVIDEELIGDYITALIGAGLLTLIFLIAEPVMALYIAPIILVPIINIARIKLKI